MPTRKGIILKSISLLSLVRGQNLMVLVIAQLLSAAFIFSSAQVPEKQFWTSIWLIVCSTMLSVAAGYIINAFFDQKKI